MKAQNTDYSEDSNSFLECSDSENYRVIIALRLHFLQFGHANYHIRPDSHKTNVIYFGNMPNTC